MINMAHCRVSNTLAALAETADYLCEKDVADLSESEQDAFFKLVKLCQEMASDFGAYLP